MVNGNKKNIYSPIFIRRRRRLSLNQPYLSGQLDQ